MGRQPHALGSNIPAGFNENLAELPVDFVMTLGLFWLFAPRLDWCLGVALNFWSENDPAERWPSEKNSQLIERLLRIAGKLEPPDLRERIFVLLSEAASLNKARNDFAHSFIVAHGPAGELFVQKVRVTNRQKTLELQEGATWSISDVKDVAVRLAGWCKEFESLLAEEARKRWPRD